MADEGGGEGEGIPEKKFFAELAKTGRAACKKCKEKTEKGKLRLGRAAFGPFGFMKNWFHVDCLFEQFQRQRATTARINTPEDIDGWSDIEDDDRMLVLRHLPDLKAEDYLGGQKEKPAAPAKSAKKGKKAKQQDAGEDEPVPSTSAQPSKAAEPRASSALSRGVRDHKDNSFREFRRLCVQIANENQYLRKTAVAKQLFDKGTDGDGFKGDLELWVRMLLPMAEKRVYNLQSKQLVKLFARILRQDHEDMLEDLEQGDVAETCSKFFQTSTHCQPTKHSHLTLHEVDRYLEELSQLTREEDQANLFSKILKRCTANDLMYIIRLIKHDLRINAGPKHILEAVHPDAYQAFQTSRDIKRVLEKVFSAGSKNDGDKGSLKITVKLMTPVLPMLAEACKTIEQAFKKCPNGMYSEIKYDGERVQLHKSGSEFKYFSRSLKPVMPHKVSHFKDYIPKAFPGGQDLILDSEILMIDTTNGKPLPFGTLGIHKKGEYKDACVCLFVFDCIYYNGESLLHKPMIERRKILHQNMTEIPNRIMFSEMEEVHTKKDLESMITKVFQMGLEGLVLKDLMSIYEPGKRHWLKVKKDYLFGGAMADSADLVVLGAFFGTGQRGGMMSVFLMGCWDPDRKRWCTVTKVHTGHDDETLERLQTELQMVKISKDASKVPSWLHCTKTMVPDFVAKDPQESPVWEITGAEFTQNVVHTADGISIRFPRVTRIRTDKTWETATSLPELKELYKKSKVTADFCLSKFESSSECESPKKGGRRKNNDDSRNSDEMEREEKSSDENKRADDDSSQREQNKVENEKKKLKTEKDLKRRKVSNSSDKEVVRKKRVKEGSSSHEKEDCMKKDFKSDFQDTDLQTLRHEGKIVPQIFKGFRIVIPDSIKEQTHHRLDKYFVGYGGELLKPSEAHRSTHVIHLQGTLPQEEMYKWPPEARHVEVDWLIDCLKLENLEDMEPYVVSVIPSV